MEKLKLTTAVLALSASFLAAAPAGAESIEFWTQTYGDQIKWTAAIKELTEAYEAETGVKVNHEIVPWSSSRKTWLAVAQGGAAPDCADMWWLHSFSAIGGDKFGPMPINDFKSKFSVEDFYEGALQDSTWRGDFYGIPWRGDIRAQLYRTDIAAEAGVTQPPENWDEVIEAARKMTKRSDNGEVETWGYSFGSAAKVVDWLMPLYWQAGGEFMTDDGKTATIDNDAMRKALTFMHDMVNVHKVADPDAFEKGYKARPAFVAGKVAMIGSAEQAWGNRLETENPEVDGKWSFSRSAAGPANRASFSGAGYLGVLRGSEKVEQCVDWLAYLSRDENMLKLSQAAGTVATKPAVMATDFWSDRPYKRVVAEALEDAHTSQHPAPAWSAISTSEPGGILYDMIYSVVIEQQDMDAAITTAQELMQAQLDR
ncbi:sugar ABC transporter substrate-binding protein [uncultured Roseibium sp.]|uniref:ABC transporter substrate-binding protein n=1 Tax=uncultured Roseibium sp. TaxID=1936171 RepID=UPI00261A1E8D|nr:sugar ABC transporter substrate-binding protein [uncultured Roseibium sp.]